MTKKICVIGAGAAGIVTAKHAIKQQYQVDVYEQTDQIGGTWVYSDKVGCHSSMYKIMKTNLPKEAMLFENVPFRDDLPSYMSHEDVLEYLEEYSSDFNINLNSTVVEVSRDNDKWKVIINKDGINTTIIYDIVFVCNGHFFEPLNPYNTSIFKGILIHSHDYRVAEQFTDKNVVIIGAGPSGIDICLQVANTAKKITMISKKATYPVLPDIVTQIATHVKDITDNGVITDEGDYIQADAIIICTGYIFKFPFLSNDIIQVKNGLIVSPLYEHIGHIHYPDSLFFIGLPLGSITFPLFEVQAKYALSVISGKGTLPSKQEMIDYEAARLSVISNPNTFHIMVDEQWEYMKKLANMGDFEEWKYMETIKKMYLYIFRERRRNVIGYKLVNFELNEDQTDFEIIQL